ncbi:hypothetical protein LTR99_009626 [Exophiala xenobiotica]|uniref:NmrA-like domain-containing protein n=1 Tax=Vermiconidia calcicola TaxID=1690605 RepID=A0AAV9PYL0_9PEZI|nr:hypothetical protein LTR92_007795 [Exophiala xenobiotica]KAK5530464.1 hypothetical protein LTR25_009042 [Vermiconidia calcicola]KAK5539095.1 hypothetical protein LTR23_006909 [Chaetothyriales sp. CCFEE 6169]KAK5272096.1 hypothetical protein LTR96_001726 [Exophiala xenobiotica]KAK5294228.1 hypothetical protein LTR99_009626 [Exophiala xenobiotica]
MGVWSSGPAPESKSQLFLTGATGYVGGQALHAIASTIPSSQVTITCLVRTVEKGKLVQKAYPEHVRIVVGDLDDVEIIEKECQKSQAVLRQLPTSSSI